MDIQGFKIWLTKNGCEILAPTNQYEAVRFKGKFVGVMYTSGRFSSPYAANAYDCFVFKMRWKPDEWLGYN